MGYMCHHAIVVTCDSKLAVLAHAKAGEILAGGRNEGPVRRDWAQLLSPIIPGIVNSEDTFIVAPDGSKEGWDGSDEGERLRAVFVAWLDAQRYDDGSTSFKWALVQYGDDEHDNRVLRHSDDNRHRALLSSS